MKPKIVLLISLLMLYVACEEESCWFVHNPAGPDPIDDPWQHGGEIEIMYVRVLPVVNPDWTGDLKAAMIYHYKYGGKNSSYFVPAGENKWIASVYLICDPHPYTISVADTRVSDDGPVAEKILLKPKREGASWVELTCIVPEPAGRGKAAKFLFNNGQISDAHPCF